MLVSLARSAPGALAPMLSHAHEFVPMHSVVRLIRILSGVLVSDAQPAALLAAKDPLELEPRQRATHP